VIHDSPVLLWYSAQKTPADRPGLLLGSSMRACVLWNRLSYWANEHCSSLSRADDTEPMLIPGKVYLVRDIHLTCCTLQQPPLSAMLCGHVVFMTGVLTTLLTGINQRSRTCVSRTSMQLGNTSQSSAHRAYGVNGPTGNLAEQLLPRMQAVKEAVELG